MADTTDAIARQPRRPGRPADAAIDDRIITAAIELFAASGWSGFNLDAVARRAQVGKAALYRRWPSREALIGDALERIVLPDTDFDTGSLRGDLLALAGHIWDLSLSPAGAMVMRVAVEARREPGVFGPRLAEIVTRQSAIGQAMIGRAVARREADEAVSTRIVFHALSGAIENRILFTPPDRLPELVAQRDAVLGAIVDFTLAGVRPAP